MTQVVSIQFPQGGFGHFTHLILSQFGKDFHCSDDAKNYQNSESQENCHDFPLWLPKYKNTDSYDSNDYKQKLSVLKEKFVTAVVSSGWHNDSQEFELVLHPAVKIRIGYDDWSWPLAVKVFYERHQKLYSKFSQNHTYDLILNSHEEDWHKREQLFLFLRDHSHRGKWRPLPNTLNISLIDYLVYNNLHSALNTQFQVDHFESVYESWFKQNSHYFDSYIQAWFVMNNLHNNTDISGITDVFTQATIYYYIWLKYNLEVPHNDYSSWFTNTKEIVKMLQEHRVSQP